MAKMTTGDISEKGCNVDVWDGPYKMKCGLTMPCHRHGPVHIVEDGEVGVERPRNSELAQDERPDFPVGISFPGGVRQP